MTRHDFQKLNLKSQPMGQVFKIDDVAYQLQDFISYTWSVHVPKPDYSEEGYTKHPNENSSVILAFDKTLLKKFHGIDININIIGYYARGPSGLYTDVRGHIGGNELKLKLVLAGSYQKRDFVEPIIIDNHVFTIEFSYNYFSLAIFEVR